MSTPDLTRYRKAIITGAGMVLAFASTFTPDNKYVIAAIAVATAFGVWRVPNSSAKTLQTPESAVVPEQRTPVVPGPP